MCGRPQRTVYLNICIYEYGIFFDILMHCDASQWRRTWSRSTANGSSTTRGFHSGTPGTPGIPLGWSTQKFDTPAPLLLCNAGPGSC